MEFMSSAKQIEDLRAEWAAGNSTLPKAGERTK